MAARKSTQQKKKNHRTIYEDHKILKHLCYWLLACEIFEVFPIHLQVDWILDFALKLK